MANKKSTEVKKLPLGFGAVAQAIIDELNKPAPIVKKEEDGQEIEDVLFKTNIDAIVEQLISKARGGDLAAIREVFDRIDGRPGGQVNVMQVLAYLQMYGREEIERMAGAKVFQQLGPGEESDDG